MMKLYLTLPTTILFSLLLSLLLSLFPPTTAHPRKCLTDHQATHIATTILRVYLGATDLARSVFTPDVEVFDPPFNCGSAAPLTTTVDELIAVLE